MSEIISTIKHCKSGSLIYSSHLLQDLHAVTSLHPITITSGVSKMENTIAVTHIITAITIITMNGVNFLTDPVFCPPSGHDNADNPVHYESW